MFNLLSISSVGGGGTRTSSIQKAYRHYGFDYTYIDNNTNMEKLVTIEEIDRITKQGHVVNVSVNKPGIGAHSLLIEGVTRAENDYCVTFYDPEINKRVTLPYEELEKVLTGHHTLPSDKQIKTREPILKKQHTYHLNGSAKKNSLKRWNSIP